MSDKAYIEESFYNFSVADDGTSRVTLTKTFTKVTSVVVTFHGSVVQAQFPGASFDDGGVYDDEYSSDPGPLIGIKNLIGTNVAGTVDVIVKGY